MEKLIVDRIVGDIAVLEKEDRSHIEVPLSEISAGIFLVADNIPLEAPFLPPLIYLSSNEEK